MPSQSTKNLSNLGCFTFIGLLIVGLFFVHWLVVLGFGVAVSIMMVLIFSILHEIKKIRKRNNTRKSLISQASEGYTELVAKINPANSDLKTWIDHVPADYSWVSFQKFHGSRHSEPRGKWRSFFDSESENNFLKISDGSGSCWISTHMSDFVVEMNIQYYNAKELLPKLKTDPISDFPFDELTESTEIKVVEKWIKKGQTLFLFGHIHDFSKGHEPLMRSAAKAWGASDHQNSARLMGHKEWSDLLQKSAESSPGIRKILTANFEAEPAERIIISNSPDSKINIRSYLAILAFLIGLLLLLYPAYIMTTSAYPEIIDWLKETLNL